jgi:hypothetical protein
MVLCVASISAEHFVAAIQNCGVGLGLDCEQQLKQRNFEYLLPSRVVIYFQFDERK